MLLVKREESRGFDVFLGVVCVFWCLEERKTCRETKKMSSFLVWGVPGAIYSFSTHFEAEALQGPPALKDLKRSWSWHPYKYFDFLFLKRYGSWKFQSDQKLWLSEVSGPLIGTSSRFSWYLNRSNSNFKP